MAKNKTKTLSVTAKLTPRQYRKLKAFVDRLPGAYATANMALGVRVLIDRLPD